MSQENYFYKHSHKVKQNHGIKVKKMSSFSNSFRCPGLQHVLSWCNWDLCHLHRMRVEPELIPPPLPLHTHTPVLNPSWLLSLLPQQNPDGSVSKESSCNAGDADSILELGRSPGEENGTPLKYSHPANPMDREAWQTTVHGVTRSQAWLSN